MSVRLRSPDGDETIDVPDEMVPHYTSLGAKIVGIEEEGIEADPLIDPSSLLPAVRMGQAGAAIARGLGSAAGRVASRFGGRLAPTLASEAGKFALEEAGGPLGRAAMRMSRILGRTKEPDEAIAGQLRQITRGGGGRQQVAQRLEREVKAEPKIAGEIKPRKPFRPKKKAKKKAEKGSAESRVMSAKEQATAREKGRAINPTTSPQAMRGASGPELERRTAMRERFKAKMEPAPPLEMADDLEAQLMRSLELEQEMAGLDPIERLLLRKAMRGE